MKNIHYFLIAFIFISCSVKNEEQNKTLHPVVEKDKPIAINPKDFERNNLSLSVFADDIKYIPLSNKLPIGFVQSLRITLNAVYLVSDNSGGGEGNGHQQLFRFDKYDNRLVPIGRVGKGPQEYLSARYFTVDETNNRIYINGKLNTVLVFDMLGNYVRKFNFQNSGLNFSKLDILSGDKLLLPQNRLGAQGLYLWYVIDTLGNIISSKNNSTAPFETHTGASTGTFKYKDKISYWIDYNDTIFEISPDLTYRASYIIAPDESLIDNLKSKSHDNLFLEPTNYYWPRFFTETNKYLINRYSYKDNYAFTFIDKETRKTFTCNYKLGKDVIEGIINDFDAGLPFFPLDYFSEKENEILVSIIQPFQLKAHVATEAFKTSTPIYPEKKKELEQLANSLDENDNPVLMLVKLKE